MAGVPQLGTYRFYEQAWANYAELRDWFEWEIPDVFNMADYVCDRHATDKRRVALFYESAVGETETYTFWQLRNRTNQLANYLAAQGVGRGDRIGVNTPQKPATAVAHIAVWKLGAVTIPLSTQFGQDALSYRLDDAGAVGAIVDESNIDTLRDIRPDLPDLQTVLTVDATPTANEIDLESAIATHSRSFDTATTAPSDNAIILYTSGTTGDPKGVVHGHELLLGHLPGVVLWFYDLEITPRDVVWCPAEWAWIASLFPTMFSAFYYGVPVLAYHGGRFEPETAFGLIERYGLSNCFIPPTALRMMMQVDAPTTRWDLDSMRVVTSGGEALGQTVADWADTTFGGAVVYEGYGQTEANLISMEHALLESRQGRFGKAPPGRETAIVDPETAEPTVPPGEVGEFAVRYEDDPIVMAEYWNKPTKTTEVRSNGWHLTGDLGRVDEDGYYSFVGRKDDVIISAGYRIGPEEIEDTITAHDAVADAGVIGIPDDQRGEVPMAFVVLVDGITPSVELRDELQDHVKNRLAAYEYPRELEFVDELPLTVTGKIRRTELREWAGDD